MAGARSAPTVDGSPTRKILTLRWIDHTGDFRSDSYVIEDAATDIAIEAFCTAMVAASNASLYEIKVADDYNSVPDSSNALEAVWENAKSNVVVQFKHPTLESIRTFIPSPLEAMFVPGSDNVDPTNAVFLAVVTNFDAIVDVDYTAVGVRFTHRRDINQQDRL